MPTYIMLTRLSPQALTEPSAVEEFNRQVQEQVRCDCPNVRWIANYAILGPYNYLDVFEASGEEEAVKLSLIVRSAGHATTETWIAKPWGRYLNWPGSAQQTGSRSDSTGSARVCSRPSERDLSGIAPPETQQRNDQNGTHAIAVRSSSEREGLAHGIRAGGGRGSR